MITYLTLAEWQMMHMLGAPPEVTLFRSIRGKWYEDRVERVVLWNKNGNVSIKEETIFKITQGDHAIVDDWIESVDDLLEMVKKI